MLSPFVDISGIRHAVEVQADSLYEAAALAIRTFRQHNYEPGTFSLDIEVRTSIHHTITVKKVEIWLSASAKGPKEMVLKQRLKELLR